jgi:hypothetical protein
MDFSKWPEEDREQVERLIAVGAKYDAHYAMRNEVHCEAMSEDWLELLDGMIKMKACYNNAFNIMSEFGHDHDVKYVIGYASSAKLGIPIDHAWTLIDGVHYDPTWQLFSDIGEKYDARFILSMSDLFDIIVENHNRPPSYWDATRITEKECD